MAQAARKTAAPVRFFVLRSVDSADDTRVAKALQNAPISAGVFTEEDALNRALAVLDGDALPVVVICAGIADAEHAAQRLLRRSDAMYLILLAAPGDERSLAERFRHIPIRARQLELLSQADPALIERISATAETLRHRQRLQAGVTQAGNVLLRLQPQPLDLTEGAIQRQLFDALPIGIAVVTDDGYVADTNEAARRLLSAGDGRPVTRLVDLIPQWSVHSADSLPAEDVITVSRGSTPRHLKIITSPLADRGTTHGVLMTIEDITEQEQARRVLTATKVELEQRVLHERDAAAEMRRERDSIKYFIASLTHDLRSPVAAAMLSCQLLQRKASLDDRGGGLLKRVMRNLERLERMVEDLLDLTRHDTGAQLPIEPQPMRLDTMLRETLDELTQIYSKPIVLQEPVPVVEGCWDVSGVRRIIENLGTNAIKYGDPVKPAEVTLAVGGRTAVMRFCNYGPPIPLAAQSIIFEPFYRAQNTSDRLIPGWGVGLAFVRVMTESHGGSVSLSSSERGTVFSVDLPLDRVAQ